MKILLDESLPRRLNKDFKGHQVKTVPEAGWQGKKNGELIKLMDGKFDIFITADQNLQYQLNLRNTTTPIIILQSPSNRYEDLRKLVTKVIKLMESSNLQKINRVA
jgi:predicted nuclease of predicted toxin-antitoxin system